MCQNITQVDKGSVSFITDGSPDYQFTQVEFKSPNGVVKTRVPAGFYAYGSENDLVINGGVILKLKGTPANNRRMLKADVGGGQMFDANANDLANQEAFFVINVATEPELAEEQFASSAAINRSKGFAVVGFLAASIYMLW